MTANMVIRARINGYIKEGMSTILAAMGLIPSDAFQILMIRIARERLF